jgi:hypothetical protein
MSNRTPRNIQLLQQIANNPFAKMVAAAFDIPADLEKDLEAVRLDRRLSPEGRKEAAEGHLRRAIRDLRDIKKPLEEYHAKTEELRAAVRMPTFDPADVIGFLRRQELRSALRSMANAGQRELLLEDPAFADAMLEQPPALSGLQPQQIGEDKSKGNQDFLLVEAAKKRRLESLFGPQLAAIAARETVESEALMIANVVRGDIAADSGLEPREFEAIAKPVESKVNAHWLRKDKDWDGNEKIYVIDVQNHRSRIATPDEIRDGQFFANFEEYQAARAA